MALTKLQQNFVTEYCADPKIRKAAAARKAGYSKDRAEITAIELMKNPEVKREIERRLTKRLGQNRTDCRDRDSGLKRHLRDVQDRWCWGMAGSDAGKDRGAKREIPQDVH